MLRTRTRERDPKVPPLAAQRVPHDGRTRGTGAGTSLHDSTDHLHSSIHSPVLFTANPNEATRRIHGVVDKGAGRGADRGPLADRASASHVRVDRAECDRVLSSCGRRGVNGEANSNPCGGPRGEANDRSDRMQTHTEQIRCATGFILIESAAYLHSQNIAIPEQPVWVCLCSHPVASCSPRTPLSTLFSHSTSHTHLKRQAAAHTSRNQASQSYKALHARCTPSLSRPYQCPNVRVRVGSTTTRLHKRAHEARQCAA